MMHPFTKLKEEQKELAAKICLLKAYRSPKYFNANLPLPDVLCTNAQGRERSEAYMEGIGYTEIDPARAAYEKRVYRHRHIAYCELRGRTREQIEPHVRDGNAPYQPRIDEIKEALQLELDEHNFAWVIAHPEQLWEDDAA